MGHFVEFQDVCKYYTMGEQRITAADHITFTIEQGEFTIIVGPSGAGKTTVLNMLGGMDTCDEGSIRLDGREISRYTRRQLTEYRRYDEPTGALDYKTGKTILQLLQDTCRNTGRTVIVITHNQALTAMADRVIRIKNGTVLSNETNPDPTPVERIEW